MRVLRFMSAAEAIKLLQGRSVVNKTVHHDAGQDSTSVGFCFTITAELDDENEIFNAATLLSGITIMHVCLIGEFERMPRRFVKTRGWYKDGYVTEVSTTKYWLRDFDQWAFYAPHGLSGLVPAYSGNWTAPVILCNNPQTKE